MAKHTDHECSDPGIHDLRHCPIEARREWPSLARKVAARCPLSSASTGFRTRRRAKVLGRPRNGKPCSRNVRARTKWTESPSAHSSFSRCFPTRNRRASTSSRACGRKASAAVCDSADIARRGRIGFYRCNECRRLRLPSGFTVCTGTIFERTHVPLHKWLYAMYLRHRAQGDLVAPTLEADQRDAENRVVHAPSPP